MSTQPASPSPVAVADACASLAAAGKPVTFTAVAEQTAISRTTLYRRHDLRQLIEQQRHQATAGYPSTRWQPRSTSSATHSKHRRQRPPPRRTDPLTEQDQARQLSRSIYAASARSRTRLAG